MNVPVKLAAFLLVLVLCFAGAYAVGAAVGPVDGPAPSEHLDRTGTPAQDDPPHGAEHGG